MPNDPQEWRDEKGSRPEVVPWRGDLTKLPDDVLDSRKNHLMREVANAAIAWDYLPGLTGEVMWRRANESDERYATFAPALDALIAVHNEEARREHAARTSSVDTKAP